jgi:hypothetical protein
VALQGAFLIGTLRVVGSRENERILIAFSLGLTLPIAAIGVISELPLPLALLPDVAFVLFLRRLWVEYRALPRPLPELTHELGGHEENELKEHTENPVRRGFLPGTDFIKGRELSNYAVSSGSGLPEAVL